MSDAAMRQQLYEAQKREQHWNEMGMKAREAEVRMGSDNAWAAIAKLTARRELYDMLQQEESEFIHELMTQMHPRI